MNCKQELLNVLCFLTVASVLDHEVVHITFTPISAIQIVLESVFNKIAVIDSRTATFPKKRLQQGGFPEIIRTFSTFSARSNMSLLFGKIGTLFIRWYTVDFLLKIFF